MNNNFIEFDLTEINSIASKLFLEYSDYKIWLFNGHMGAGKTTIIKSICDFLGVVGNVSSPTFSVVNEYVTSDNSLIYHFDFYRINHETEALDLGVDEYFESNKYCFLEWASKIESLLPQKFLQIDISIVNSNTRKLSVLCR